MPFVGGMGGNSGSRDREIFQGHQGCTKICRQPE